MSVANQPFSSRATKCARSRRWRNSAKVSGGRRKSVKRPAPDSLLPRPERRVGRTGGDETGQRPPHRAAISNEPPSPADTGSHQRKRAFLRTPVGSRHFPERLQQIRQRSSDVHRIVDLHVEDSLSRHGASDQLADCVMNQKVFPTRLGPRRTTSLRGVSARTNSMNELRNCRGLASSKRPGSDGISLHHGFSSRRAVSTCSGEISITPRSMK
jgi:hypothetical protein